MFHLVEVDSEIRSTKNRIAYVEKWLSARPGDERWISDLNRFNERLAYLEELKADGKTYLPIR
jgi:hypothetical protein